LITTLSFRASEQGSTRRPIMSKFLITLVVVRARFIFLRNTVRTAVLHPAVHGAANLQRSSGGVLLIDGTVTATKNPDSVVRNYPQCKRWLPTSRRPTRRASRYAGTSLISEAGPRGTDRPTYHPHWRNSATTIGLYTVTVDGDQPVTRKQGERLARLRSPHRSTPMATCPTIPQRRPQP